MNTTVSIYERVKSGGKWTTVPVELPKLRKKDGQPSLQDNRPGKFRISWYENRTKHWQTVTSRISPKELPYLSDAIRQAEDKSWFLSNRHRNVPDPTLLENRKELHREIRAYLDGKSGCTKTVSAHSHALTEFQGWATNKKRGIFYVDEISKALLKRFFEFLVDGDDDEDGPENAPFTAALKLMKVNSFYRAVFQLEQGKGVIKKSDYKRELKSSKVPEVYTRHEMNAMFAVMDEDEHLQFSVLEEAGLRKREFMFLEDSDLICDELAPGYFKCEIRVQSKPHWKFQTKTGAARNIVISKQLMDRLLSGKAKTRPSKLLFATSKGKPDYHLWDKLKSIAKRAGIDPATVWLHKWRATAATNWLRSKELGGKGWDIGYVRQRLGHEDLKSIEYYIALVSNEEMALREYEQDNAARPVTEKTATQPLKPGLASDAFDINSADTDGWHRA